MASYQKNLSEPWFTLIKLGIKKVEGRLNKGDFQYFNIGDTITFTNNQFGFIREYSIKIKQIRYYYDFRSYLIGETLEKTLPGIDTLDQGLKIYYNYFTEEEEKLYGIKAFIFE